MVQKKEPRQEQTTYSPYYYPNFSRYNYPAKIDGDEEYEEYKFFPHWDDEVQSYTPPTRFRRSSSPPLLYTTEGAEDYSPSDNEKDKSELICDLAHKDQKTNYDQFRKFYATFHDDIHALQREIEAVCMKNGWDLKKGDDPEPISTNTYEGSGLASMPSATSAVAAARDMISKKPSILYKTNQQQYTNFNDNNNANNRVSLFIYSVRFFFKLSFILLIFTLSRYHIVSVT